MQDFKKLDIWNLGMELTEDCYMLCHDLPYTEKYELIHQVQSAVKSIPTNIAEGSSRRSIRDFYRFLEIALGSAFELETHLLIISRLGLLTTQNKLHLIIDKTIKEQKMIYSLMKTLHQ